MPINQKQLRTLFYIVLLLTSVSIFSQETTSDKVLISGNVIDSILKQPIEFATISFRNNADLLGTTSDRKGHFQFQIEPGSYIIKIEFLSYKPIELKKDLISDTDLGTIMLSPSVEELEEIKLVTQKDLVEYYVDKKIYNAAKDIANYGGNALDVLNHTPAVRVDSDGNISLRGSSATVLIDGKPVLGLDDGTNVLSTIPSNTIEKVEIITRSAKYSASGGGGILNIITKKKKGNEGLNGSLDAHIGIPENNGFSTFLNENTDKINIFSTISFNNGKRIKRTHIDQTYFNDQNDITGLFNESIRDDNQKNSFLFNIGSDFYLNSKNTLTTSLLINTNNKDYDTKIDLNDYDASGNLMQHRLRNSSDGDDVSKIETFLNYTSKFNEEGHQLSFDFKYDNTISDDDATIREHIITPTENTITQKIAKDQDLDNFLFQLDYKLPLSEKTTLELGQKTTFQFYKNNYKVNQFDPLLQDFITIAGYTDAVNYDEKVYAFYGQFGANYEKFSYTLGLRAEISNMKIGTNTTNTITKKYTDIFPSASIGYEFENGSYLSANYSRGIDRPQITQINPFISLNDERFQSVGNPDLNPYYSDYFEALYDISFEKLSIASSIFLNNSKNHYLTVIQSIGTNDEGSELYRRIPINSGDKNILGWDLDLTYKPIEWLRLRSYVSPYRLEIKNTIDNLYDYKSTVLYVEGSMLLSFKNGLRFQVTDKYQSPVENRLTKMKAVNAVDATLSKDILDKKATIALKGVDIFNSKWFKYDSQEAGTHTLRNARYDRQFTLSFTYRFNQKRRNSKDRSLDINKDNLEDRQDEKL